MTIDAIEQRLRELLARCPDPHYAALLRREIDALIALAKH